MLEVGLVNLFGQTSIDLIQTDAPEKSNEEAKASDRVTLAFKERAIWGATVARIGLSALADLAALAATSGPREPSTVNWDENSVEGGDRQPEAPLLRVDVHEGPARKARR